MKTGEKYFHDKLQISLFLKRVFLLVEVQTLFYHLFLRSIMKLPQIKVNKNDYFLYKHSLTPHTPLNAVFFFFLTHAELFHSLYLYNLLQVVKTYNYSSSSKEHSNSFYFLPNSKCIFLVSHGCLVTCPVCPNELIRAVQCEHSYL